MNVFVSDLYHYQWKVKVRLSDNDLNLTLLISTFVMDRSPVLLLKEKTSLLVSHQS